MGGFFRNVKSHNSKMSSNVCFFAAGNILKVMNRACLTKNANPDEQNEHESSIRPFKNNFVRMKIKLLFILITFSAFNFQAEAQGDLLITPKRVVFEGSKQKEGLSLVNIGKDTATFSISFVQRNMNEDGSFVTVNKSDSGQMFADPYLRIFPRTVTLAPGEPQVIMLQCRRKPDMKAGEYRSHLYFRSEVSNKPLGMGKAGKDSKTVSVQLTPVFGLSIPIIIRSGEVNVSATLSDLKLEIQGEKEQILKLTINRTGNISIYGNITVEYIPLSGKSYEIGAITGVGVYTNITKRNVSIKLNNPSGKPLKGGKLKVLYTGPEEAKYPLYDEEEMVIK